MAVVGVAQETVDKRELHLREDGHRDYRRQFWVEVNNRFDDGSVVLQAPGLPKRYAFYLTANHQDFEALCVNLRARQKSNTSFYWDVFAEYSTDHGDQEKENLPLAEPPEITFGFEKTKRIVTGEMKQGVISLSSPHIKTVVSSTGVVTSAGEPFDPPPEVEDSRPVLTITRNEGFFDSARAIKYQDAVNSDFFFGALPGQAKVSGITAVRRQRNNIFYWRVTYRIVFRRDFWSLELLDRGTFWKDGAGVINVFHDEGKARLGLLDGAGDKLAAGAAPVFLKFQVYREEPFSVLRLPQNIIR